MDMAVEWVSLPRSAVTALPSAAAAKPPWPEEAAGIWQLRMEDKTLSNTLARWAQQDGWQLVWDAERDFPIESQVSLQGSFVEVIRLVMDSLADTDYPLQAILNPDTRVLRIARYMELPARR